jgi:hypothetical protein
LQGHALLKSGLLHVSWGFNWQFIISLLLLLLLLLLCCPAVAAAVFLQAKENLELRMKYADEPMKFIENEVDLLSMLRGLAQVGSQEDSCTG